jgi:hypothetical protein
MRGYALIICVLLGGCGEVNLPDQHVQPNNCGPKELVTRIGHYFNVQMHDYPQEKLRVYKSGSNIQQNYLEKRLNIEVNEQHMIVKVWCG